MKSLMMYVDCIACCQGMMPMIVKFIEMYSAATATIATMIARGIVTAGRNTSPPTEHTVL